MKKELFRYIISGILVLAAGIIYIVNFPGPGEKIECVIEETGVKVPTKAEKPETDGRTPEGDDKEPEADEKTPEADEKTPEADGKAPEADGKTPEGDGKTPEADGKTPEADDKEPEVAENTTEADGKKDDDIQISESGRININTAGPEELMKLSGIGQVRANSIINYREENGDFETVEDIMKVPGIKMGIYRKISEYITVD